jgi:hypothetical protein
MVDKFIFQMECDLWCNMGIIKIKMINYEGESKETSKEKIDFEQIKTCSSKLKSEEAFDLAWKETGEKMKKELFKKGENK